VRDINYISIPSLVFLLNLSSASTALHQKHPIAERLDVFRLLTPYNQHSLACSAVIVISSHYHQQHRDHRSTAPGVDDTFTIRAFTCENTNTLP
jgi:hypothetical protein